MRVAVVGLGLIGGSIGMACRQRAGASVCGYDADERVLERALAAGAIDELAGSAGQAAAGAQVAFVAAPVGALARCVELTLAGAGADCVVSDVGSTKRVVAAAAAADERFIGGHPLAGAETSGVENARADLFEGATWYLTPAPDSTAGVMYERLHRLLVTLGAHPTAIDADAHDRLMACVSHLPHVLANLLASQAAGMLADEGAQRLPAVGPSFRDATRVAGASSSIWTDIYMSNSDALVARIDKLQASLALVREMLAGGRAAEVTQWNDRARADRDALLGAALVGGPVQELRASVPNRPGVIAEIALALGNAGVNIVDMALSPSPDNSQGVVALWIGGDDHSQAARELIAGLGFPVASA